jgi:phage-related protein
MLSIFNVTEWDQGRVYQQNDAVLKAGKYYYALRDVPASQLFNSFYWGGYPTTPATPTAKPVFIWKPSYNVSVNHTPRIKSIQFGDGYEQRIQDGINNQLLNLEMSFDLRTRQESSAILHFFYARNGVESFLYTPNAPYGTQKKFICKEWAHSELFLDNHSVRVKFEERVD